LHLKLLSCEEPVLYCIETSFPGKNQYLIALKASFLGKTITLLHRKLLFWEEPVLSELDHENIMRLVIKRMSS